MSVAKSGTGRERLGEFGIIARYFAPLATDTAALGLKDDTAVLRPPEGQEIVLSCDTVVEGVHFRKDDPPDTIAHKALAVNLSDLAAKGARPYVYLLALSLPTEPPAKWFDSFADGLRALQERSGICLAGGDTTKAPGRVSISVTVLGLVPQGHAVLRHGAKPGDQLYVSGTIGDAHLGLRLLEQPSLAKTWGLTKQDAAFAIGRYQSPEPRTDLTLVVRNFAQAAIDVSDGLVLDAEKLAQVSHVDAVIEADTVPLSAPARKAIKHDAKLLETLIAAGDDYEIVAAIPAPSVKAFEAEARAKGVAVTPVGRVEDGDGAVRVLGRSGKPLKLARKGFTHF
jgi:thiamine-monophosphate kinase